MQAIPHGNRKYNWHKWCDGKWRKAKQGYHFACTPHSFRVQVLAKARSLGCNAQTRQLSGGVIAFCICPKDEAKNI